MANNAFQTQDVAIETIVAQKAKLQKELDLIKYQLEQAAKSLAQKDQIIGSLEQDLEHMIDQLGKITHKHTNDQAWIDRQLPGINVENSAVAQ